MFLYFTAIYLYGIPLRRHDTRTAGFRLFRKKIEEGAIHLTQQEDMLTESFRSDSVYKSKEQGNCVTDVVMVDNKSHLHQLIIFEVRVKSIPSEVESAGIAQLVLYGLALRDKKKNSTQTITCFDNA